MKQSENGNLTELSLNQRNIWNLESAFKGTSINNISTTVRITGRMDARILKETLAQIIAKDPTLRTRITTGEDKEPKQYFSDPAEEEFPVFDFSTSGEEGLAIWEDALARQPLALCDAPLYRFWIFRTGEHTGGVLIKIHHIISDGWSQALLCNRIAQTYFELLRGQTLTLEDAPSYQTHVKAEQVYLNSMAYQKDKTYWAGQMQQFDAPSALKDVKGATISPVGRRKSFRLPHQLNHAIYTYCMENRVAPFSVYYMALAAYFKRMGTTGPFTIGVPVFNRSTYLLKQCTGMFVSTLPFIHEIDEEWTLAEFTEKMAESWYELLRHQRFPFKEICALTPTADGRLFQIALSYQDSKLYESADTAVTFSGRWHYSGYQAEQLCIHLSNFESLRDYTVDYDYLTQFFCEDEICALHERLMNLLSEALANPTTPLCHLSTLCAAEKEQVLYTFNRTARPLLDTGVFAAFEREVQRHPDRVALICQNKRMTYRALSDRAAAFCAAIEDASRDSSGLTAILLPREFDLFGAMLGALRAGGSYLLLTDDIPPMRAAAILKSSASALLVTGPEWAEKLAGLLDGLPVLTLPLPKREKAPGPAAKSDAEKLAYVVYTSGSTGTPKGVEITQKSLLNLAQAMEDIYSAGAVLSMCNVGFDAFVLESACALLNARTILLPTAEELSSPARLGGLITGYAAGFLATTPSRLLALMEDADFSRAMHRIDRVVCGGEAFPRELLRLLQAATDARIYNQYGPSETTVAVSHKKLNAAGAITVGTPLQNCRFYVLDKWRNPLPVGVFGELYIGGVCVGKGYRCDPQLTQEKFVTSPFESGERMYRTGDTACWTENGELVLAGRSDMQIKLRGLRIEPQEIVSCLCAFPGIQSAAVRAVEHAGQTVLVGYYVAEKEVSYAKVLTFAAAYLPYYMVPSALVRVDAIALTRNGKIDESLLPEPSWNAQKPENSAGGWTQEVLRVFCQVLKNEMSADDDYFLSGGNSLSAMQTLAQLEECVHCTLHMSDLYACRTARRLAELIGQKRGEGDAADLPQEPAIGKAQPRAAYPLTPMQRDIYFQSNLDENGLLYNMTGAFCVACTLDADRLQQAFEKLVAEDSAFRTSFVLDEKGLYARVEENVPFVLQHLDTQSAQEAGRVFAQPFDLAAAPLLRAGIWKNKPGETVLFVDMHHIIADGLSTPILLRRLAAYYAGEQLPQPPVDHLDYACWLEQSPVNEKNQQFWKEHLTPMPPRLVLPCDAPRAGARQTRGKRHSHPLPEALCARVDALCQKQDISAYNLFLAAFGQLLFHLGGQQEFTVGTPVSSRMRPELQQVCGPFLNVLPVRLSAGQDQSVTAYLQAVKQEIGAVLDHACYAPQELVSLLGLPHTSGASPLYTVMMSMRPFDLGALTFGDAALTYLPVETDAAKTEFALEVGQNNGAYSLCFEYASDLFTDETIAFYARSLQAVTEAFTGEADLRLEEVFPLSAQDRFALIDMPEHLYTPYLNLPIHEQVSSKALMQPDAPAIFYQDKVVTRRQLEEKAGQVAAALQGQNVGRGDVAAVLTKRTPALLAGMLGILKTGAAYLPLVESLPAERLAYMIKTAGVKAIVCDEASAQALPAELVPLAVVPSAAAPANIPTCRMAGTDLANVIFTSGSTGRPKGVMVPHGAVSNLVASMKTTLAGVTGPALCTASPVFDIFLNESLIPLALGLPVVLADETQSMLPWALAQLIRERKVGFIQLAASRLAMCLSNEAFCAAIGQVSLTVVGGESVSPSLVARFKAHSAGRLVNQYGPTETTVYITSQELADKRPVTIGKPAANCRVYLLNDELQRVLPTAQGEMYLAGAGVARGYIGSEELTRTRFLPDPFVPGETMYRSGDMGRLRINGQLEFCGRQDGQIKINGQRMEPDEIAGVLQASPLVSVAQVIAVKKQDASPVLHAFYVPQPGQNASPEALTAYLKEYLPSYMIPAFLHPLSEMPSTLSGKVDLQAMRRMAGAEDGEPQKTAAESAVQPDMPQAKAEEQPASPAVLQPDTPQDDYTKPQPAACSNSEPQAFATQKAPQKDLLQKEDAAAKAEQETPPAAAAQPDFEASPARAACEQQPAAGQPEAPQPAPPVMAAAPQPEGELPQPAAGTPPAGAAVQPAKAAEEKGSTTPFVQRAALVSIWKEVLHKEKLEENDSFFDQGGTSLDVLSTLSRYHNLKLDLTIAQFYNHPTLAQQFELLKIEQEANPPQDSLPEKAALCRTVPKAAETQKKAYGTVFLTGATGYLGAHLLCALLKSGTKRIVCIVRNDSARLWESLAWYFGAGWTASARQRVEAVTGDIAKPLLGLEEAEYTALAGRVDAVYHAAADVRHFTADEAGLLASNLEGTRRVLAFALAAGADYHHMSSLSVSGEYLTETPEQPAVYTEQDAFIGQNFTDSVYVKSKLLAEAEVFDAVRRQGLAARVYRLGRLVGRASDGVFQRNPDSNMFVLFLRSACAVGAVPEEIMDVPCELTPVDTAAEAVVALHGAAGTVFHIANPHPPTMGQVFGRLLPEVRQLDGSAFDRHLAADAAPGPLSGLLEQTIAAARRHPTRITPSFDATLAALAGAGHPALAPDTEILLNGLTTLVDMAKAGIMKKGSC